MDPTPLAPWDTFYVIVGSAAAALTGLQFVVIAIVADSRSRSATAETLDAFGTPNIVHFSAVLLVSAVLSAPWPSLRSVDFAMGACAVAGLVYGVIVVRRARRQTGRGLGRIGRASRGAQVFLRAGPRRLDLACRPAARRVRPFDDRCGW